MYLFGQELMNTEYNSIGLEIEVKQALAVQVCILLSSVEADGIRKIARDMAGTTKIKHFTHCAVPCNITYFIR